MNFLTSVNRVLRSESVIAGDDADITSFSDTQHEAAISLAKIAIQDELTDLVANDFVELEQANSTITLVQGQQVYNLASNFVRFMDSSPFLLKVDGSGVSQNEFATFDTEANIRRSVLDYRTAEGSPTRFYFTAPTSGTTRAIGVFNVPDASGDIYRYDYEKDVSVTLGTDTLPFTSTLEGNTFVRIAARRFKYMFATKNVREGLFPNGIEKDPVILSSRATLFQLMSGVKADGEYGRQYADS